MIVVTGAAGFIGSCLVGALGRAGHQGLVAVDDFSRADKHANLAGKALAERVERRVFPAWLEQHAGRVRCVFHLGARTDTTSSDAAVFEELNLGYSRRVWSLCSQRGVPLVYASSAATYGAGEHGYLDDESLPRRLQPLNAYGRSKNDFDVWALAQRVRPPFWAGLKFFNVYGPNEAHKGRMASVVFHAFRQIRDTGRLRLFRSHRPDVKDGEQRRDFIYVKDVCAVLLELLGGRIPSGLYNLGTGRARTFLDLARSVFRALGRPEQVEFIDTPADIRDTYQYFTEARMEKLRAAGFTAPFTTLEDGVHDYVTGHLLPGRAG